MSFTRYSNLRISRLDDRVLALKRLQPTKWSIHKTVACYTLVIRDKERSFDAEMDLDSDNKSEDWSVLSLLGLRASFSSIFGLKAEPWASTWPVCMYASFL